MFMSDVHVWCSCLMFMSDIYVWCSCPMFMSDVHVWAHLVQSFLLIQINLCKGKWKPSFSGHLVPFTAFPKLFPFFVIKYVSSLSETINIIVWRNINVILCNTIWKAQRCPWKFFFKWKKKLKKSIFKPMSPQATNECPQKRQPIRSSRLAGFKEHIYECLVLLFK